MKNRTIDDSLRISLDVETYNVKRKAKEKKGREVDDRLIIVNFSHASRDQKERKKERKKCQKIHSTPFTRQGRDPLSPGTMGRRYLNCNACLVHDFAPCATLSPVYLHVAHDE